MSSTSVPVTTSPKTLAYVTTYDSLDVTRWSGTGFYISKALEDQGHALRRIGNLRHSRNPLNIMRYLWNKKVRGLNDHPHRDPRFLQHYARQVGMRLGKALEAGTQIDAIFTPGILPIAYLETDLPIVVWTDCTFAGLLNYYPAWTNMSERSIRDGHEADRRGLRKAELLIFTSQWAADSAVRDYGCDPKRIAIVPLGANVSVEHSRADVEAMAASRLASPIIRFLLPGVNWKRKGCDFAIQVVAEVNRRGLRAQLDIVGCHAPEGTLLPPFVRTHGFVSKASPAGRAFIEDKFRQATFLLLPTVAECTAVVFNEAASFGLPVLTTDTGGTPSIVLNGCNGFTFPIVSEPAHWADKAAELVANNAAYSSLCQSSLAEYSSRLNWKSTGSAVSMLLSRLLSYQTTPAGKKR
jgi:glycosyltransferase involved in cell wall biosynthesis